MTYFSFHDPNFIILDDFSCALRRVTDYQISMAFRVVRQRREARRNAKMEEIFMVHSFLVA